MKRIYRDTVILLFLFLFAGILSISMGMDRFNDIRNYHIYNPYAFLEGRLLTDIMPAGIQSYFNPLADIPYYLCIKYFNNHPVFITFLCGFSYALLLFMIFKISELIFKKNENHLIYSIISVIICSGLFTSVRLLGWISHDLFVGDLALISLYLILKIFGKEKNQSAFLISGFIMGSAVGLKLTAIIFAIPLFITCIFSHKKFNNPLRAISVLCLGMLLGFIVFDGFWLYTLYKNFGNPFFPYFNWIFKSDILAASNVYSVDFIKYKPNNFYNGLLAPFLNQAKQYSFDSILLYVIFFINLITIPFLSKKNINDYFKITLEYFDFILIFIFWAYIIWLNTFAVMRYFSPVIGLTGIIAIIVFMKIFYIVISFISKREKKDITEHNKTEKTFIIYLAIFLLTIFAPNYTFQNQYKLVRVPITDKLLDIEDMQIPDNSIVLVKHGCAIFIPFQNSNAKYIHINAYPFSKNKKSILSKQKTKELKEMIKQNSNKVYALIDIDINEIPNISIKKVNNKIDSNNKIKKEEIKLINKIKKEKNQKKRKKLYSKLNSLPKIKKVRPEETTVLDLNKMGINTKTLNCKEIKSNIFDSKYYKTYKHPVFYLCKAEIK